MNKLHPLWLLSVLLFIACSGSVSQDNNLTFAKDNGGITLPDGFKAVVVAEDVGKARHITTADNGDIYVALSQLHNGHGTAALRDKDGDGKAETVKYFGSITGTGIQLHNDYLYRSSDTGIVRYKIDSEKLVPSSDPQTVVGGFAKQSQHAAKSFTLDDTGKIYVNIGGPANACQKEMRTPGSAGMDPCPLLKEHAGIWQYDANETGQKAQQDGHRYATGIRNSVALDWNSNEDQLYVVQHGRDQLHSLWPDLYDQKESVAQPGEEFFLVNEGDNFGWPYTYYNWKKEQKMKAPEYGGDGETPAEEDKYKDPVMAFPGHWAPNDLLFYDGSQFPEKYQNGAFVAFHGSWNRAPEPQKGYKVAFVPFDGSKPSGDYTNFADGFAGSKSLQSPSGAKYRPMGLAPYKDGSLLIIESNTGKIWRIIYTGK